MIQTIWNTKFYSPKKAPVPNLETLTPARRKVYVQVAAGKTTARQVADATGLAPPTVRKQLHALVRDRYITRVTPDRVVSNALEYRVAA